MRIALVFLLACSGSSATKPEPATPTEPEPIESKAMPVEEPPAPEPVEQISDAVLEEPAKPASGSQAKIAWQSNRDGVALAKAQNYGDAGIKFRDAVARVPEAAYFYNLCHAYYQEGRFAEALTACGAVGKNEPLPALAAKTDQLSARIQAQAKRQGIEVTK